MSKKNMINEKNVKEHIDVYGAYNDQRLTGEHETQIGRASCRERV